MTGIFRAFGALFFNARAAEPKETEAAAPRERGTILAIDDDPSALDALRSLLQTEGFTVLTTVSGAKGLNMARYCNGDLHLVLLDFAMPQLNGVETLSFLRKFNPRVKVIAVTGIDSNFLPEEFRTGVDRIVTKPYATRQLLEVINQVLAPAPAVSAAHS